MSLKQESVIAKNGKEFIHTFSDRNKYIIQVESGNRYASAMDLKTHPKEYIESDEDMPVRKEGDKQ